MRTRCPTGGPRPPQPRELAGASRWRGSWSAWSHAPPHASTRTPSVVSRRHRSGTTTGRAGIAAPGDRAGQRARDRVQRSRDRVRRATRQPAPDDVASPGLDRGSRARSQSNGNRPEALGATPDREESTTGDRPRGCTDRSASTFLSEGDPHDLHYRCDMIGRSASVPCSIGSLGRIHERQGRDPVRSVHDYARRL